MLYVTYKYGSVLKRGILSPNQYEKYLKDTMVTEMKIYPNQSVMEENYSSITGTPFKQKKLLLG